MSFYYISIELSLNVYLYPHINTIIILKCLHCYLPNKNSIVFSRAVVLCTSSQASILMYKHTREQGYQKVAY